MAIISFSWRLCFFMAIICFNGNLGFYFAIMSFFWQLWVFNGDYIFLLPIMGF